MSEQSSDIWILDDDRSIRWVMERALSAAGYAIRSFAEASDLQVALADSQPQVLISDVRLRQENGLDLLGQLRRDYPAMQVLIITAYGDLKTSVQAYGAGAFEYLTKPFDIDELLQTVARACEAAPSRDATRLPRPNQKSASLLGHSPVMQRLFQLIGRLSQSELNTLVIGETGTGKELVARALHEHSPRSAGPFVAINAAAVPPDLLESELFGHERGAFTGAQQTHVGRFQQADGGTLFLDEIGDMPVALQARLLRVLAEGEFYRVGGASARRADVRIVSATNQDLNEAIADGRFRRDLLHRLNVVTVRVPPLRERGEDAIELAESCLAEAAREQGLKQPRELDDAAKQALRTLPFPGNVRELRNLCQRLTAMGNATTIGADEVREFADVTAAASAGLDDWTEQLQRAVSQQLAAGQLPSLTAIRDEFEQAVIAATLKHTGGHRQEAARLLGIGRNTLTRKYPPEEQ